MTEMNDTNRQSAPSGAQLDKAQALRILAKRSYAVIATTSLAGNGHVVRSHSAGVLYALIGRDLFFSTMRSSRKARNILANPHIGVTIPVRRVPIGPPSAVMFQARAALLDQADPEIRDRAASGDLKVITGHGELDVADGCFVKITLPDRLLTYGLGMSLVTLIRDPLNAAGFVDLGSEA